MEASRTSAQRGWLAPRWVCRVGDRRKGGSQPDGPSADGIETNIRDRRDGSDSQILCETVWDRAIERPLAVRQTTPKPEAH